jgi:hypothetical protein
MEILIISHQILFQMRNVSDKLHRQNQNTHGMLSNFFPKNSALYVEKYGRARQAGDNNIVRLKRDTICVSFN